MKQLICHFECPCQRFLSSFFSKKKIIYSMRVCQIRTRASMAKERNGFSTAPVGSGVSAILDVLTFSVFIYTVWSGQG